MGNCANWRKTVWPATPCTRKSRTFETLSNSLSPARWWIRGMFVKLGVAGPSISRRSQSVPWRGEVARLRERQQRIRQQTASLTAPPPETRSDRAIGLLADQRDLEPLFAQCTRSL